MSKYLDSKILFFLQKAISNDIYLDNYFKKKNNNESKISKKLPKFQKREIFFAKYGKWYLTIERLTDIFFPIIVFSYIIFKLTNYSIKLLLKKKSRYICVDDLFFVNGWVSYDISCNFINNLNLDSNKLFFLRTCNFESICFNNCTPIDLLTHKELHYIFKLTIYSFFKFKKEYLYYSFISVDWLVLLFAFIKIEYKKLHSFDHYDRYAVCADAATYIKKNNNVEYIFHQHGILNNNLDFILNYKINYISNAFLFDLENSLLSFQRSISNSRINSSKIAYLPNIINVTELHTDQRYKILFVGNAHCRIFHSMVIANLIKDKNILIYFKPHPNDKSIPNLSKETFVIKSASCYPKVDLVFSYNSTLLERYIEKGVDYILHDLNESNYKIYIELILNKIKKNCRTPNQNG